jgi:hypothetical protein
MRAAEALAAGDLEQARLPVATAVETHDDPEVAFLMALGIASLGDIATALTYLERCVRNGFYAYPTLTRLPLLEPIRDDPRFHALVAWARERRDLARTLFVSEGGARLLHA